MLAVILLLRIAFHQSSFWVIYSQLVWCFSEWLILSDGVIVVPLRSLYQDGSGRQCLLLERVVKSDAGWYTLSAINVAGMSTCNARLDVSGEC